MDAQLQSANISLLFDYGEDPMGHRNTTELWEMLKKTTVEPGLTYSPDFISFADECLFCAQIATNKPVPFLKLSSEEHSNNAADDTQSFESSPDTLIRHSPNYIPENQRVGFIYLHAGPANVPAHEANIGVIVKPAMRHRGYALEAVQLVLRWAFEELRFHRVQAAIFDMPSKDSALRLFIGSGFKHEGTRRRSVYQPEGEGMVGTWKDVTYLALLDTEWSLQSTRKQNNQLRAVTLWDEMLTRHANEREELLKSEEKREKMKKSSSTETLRERVRNAVPDLAYLTDDTSSFGEPSRASSRVPSPRPLVRITLDEDSEMEDVSADDELYDEWEAITEAIEASRVRENTSLQPTPLGRMLSLTSIPSRLSESMPQSPMTIPSVSTPGSSPPLSPSPPPSSSSWMDSEGEEDPLLSGASPATLRAPLETPRGPFLRAGSVSVRSVYRSSSVSSDASDSWSDAQSSVSADSSSWDVISNTSSHSPRERL